MEGVTVGKFEGGIVLGVEEGAIEGMVEGKSDGIMESGGTPSSVCSAVGVGVGISDTLPEDGTLESVGVLEVIAVGSLVFIDVGVELGTADDHGVGSCDKNMVG